MVRLPIGATDESIWCMGYRKTLQPFIGQVALRHASELQCIFVTKKCNKHGNAMTKDSLAGTARVCGSETPQSLAIM